MIIRRKLKIFARRDEFPDDLRREFFKDMETERRFGGIKTIVEPSKRYLDQRNSQTPANCDIINGIIKDLKSNLVFSDPSGKNTDPHYLSDYSKTKDKDPFVMFSKKINNEDRLNYKVYKPEIAQINGKEEYIQRVVLDSCVGHTISGKPGSYVSGQIGNTWKKRKKKVKKNRFKS